MPSYHIVCPTCAAKMIYIKAGRKGKIRPDIALYCEESRRLLKETGKGLATVDQCPFMRRQLEAEAGIRLS